LRIVGLQTVGRFEEEHVLGFGVGVRSWSCFFEERERERERCVLDRSTETKTANVEPLTTQGNRRQKIPPLFTQ
jgi:hypothetical protein